MPPQLGVPEPPSDKQSVRDAANVLRALLATCPNPKRLPGTRVLQYAAMHLRLELPDVLATGDYRRIESIGLKREYARALLDSYDRHSIACMRTAVEVLSAGLPLRHLRGALDAWGTEAAARVQRDPYGAVFDLKGTLEDAEACTTAPPGMARMVQHARWLLKAGQRDGHSLVPYDDVAGRVGGRSGATPAAVAAALAAGVRDNVLARVGDGLADPQLCAAELAIATEVGRRAREQHLHFDDYEFDGLTTEQLEGVRAVFGATVAVLTGGAGTGKSHVIRAIVDAIGPDDCLLTAPTGRAARHVGGCAAGGARTGARPWNPCPAPSKATSFRPLTAGPRCTARVAAGSCGGRSRRRRRRTWLPP